MKITLFARFALALVLAGGTVVLLALWSMRSGFESGFLDYVNRTERERLQELARFLADEYRLHGNWSFVTDDPDTWSLVVARSPQRSPRAQRGPGRFANDRRPPPRGGPSPRSREGDNRRPPPDRRRPDSPSDGPGFERPPVSLLNSEREVLVGETYDSQTIEEPIRVGRRTVGYLQSSAVQVLQGQADQEFVARQGARLGLIAIATVGVLLLVALTLARQITVPIRRLSRQLGRLAEGRYESRLERSATGELGELEEHANHLAHALEQNQGEEADRLGHLVNDLSELTLSDIGALNYQMTRVAIDELIGDAVLAHERRSADDDIRLEMIDLNRHELTGDRVRLRQLLDNLLENSLRYTASPGRITVSGTTAPGDGTYVICIDDSPPAVPEETLCKLFEPLYRTDDARSRRNGGAGLGLAICANIVEAHSGRIEASISPLGGLRITVSLP
jgi:two-component system sensor histidine kinase BaeS